MAPWAREVLNALHLYLPDRAPLDGAGGLAAGLYVPREALVSGVAEAAPFLVAFLVLGFLLFRGRDL